MCLRSFRVEGLCASICSQEGITRFSLYVCVLVSVLCECLMVVAVTGMTEQLLGMSWEDSPVSHHHISWN